MNIKRFNETGIFDPEGCFVEFVDYELLREQRDELKRKLSTSDSELSAANRTIAKMRQEISGSGYP